MTKYLYRNRRRVGIVWRRKEKWDVSEVVVIGMGALVAAGMVVVIVWDKLRTGTKDI